MLSVSAMTDYLNPHRGRVDDPNPRRHGTHWAWFVGVLAGLALVGLGVAVVLMLPLAMATDNCHDGSTDRVCTLSAAGQNLLVMIPWMCLGAGLAAAIVGAAVCARFRRTPLIGIPIGMAAYLAMIPVGYEIAFHV